MSSGTRKERWNAVAAAYHLGASRLVVPWVVLHYLTRFELPPARVAGTISGLSKGWFFANGQFRRTHFSLSSFMIASGSQSSAVNISAIDVRYSSPGSIAVVKLKTVRDSQTPPFHSWLNNVRWSSYMLFLSLIHRSLLRFKIPPLPSMCPAKSCAYHGMGYQSGSCWKICIESAGGVGVPRGLLMTRFK